MEKGNKIRFVIWGLVWLVVLVCTGYGMYSYYNGYGISGKVREQLEPIVKSYNNLNKVKRFNEMDIGIKATLLKKGINIKYSTTVSTLSFDFNYEEIDNQKVLHAKYNIADETVGILVASTMFDAISVKNGHAEDELFNKFEFGELYKTTIEQGGKIVTTNNTTEVYVNINNTLLETMSEEVLMEKYISESDISNLKEALASSNSYSYTKSQTQLYIEVKKEKYIVYLRNGNYDDNLYKSLKSVINLLPLSDDTKKEFTDNYSKIDNPATFGHYIIVLDNNVESMDYFIGKDKVIKAEITKDKTDTKKEEIEVEETEQEETETEKAE